MPRLRDLEFVESASNMDTRLPRLRLAIPSEYVFPGIEGRPQDFPGCLVVDDPKLKVELTFYDEDPEENPEEAPMYVREISVSTKKGIVFSLFGRDCIEIKEHTTEKEKEKDDQKTWTLGLTGMKGVEYLRLKIMDA